MTPPAGLDAIIATFGSIDAPDFEIVNIVSFPLPYTMFFNGAPVTHTRCHRLLVETFEAVYTKVRDAGYADHYTEFEGIYCRRQIRGQLSHPSTHSWGIADDCGARLYPLGSTARMPDPILAIYAGEGFFYGGDFKSRRDPMHHQFCTAY